MSAIIRSLGLIALAGIAAPHAIGSALDAALSIGWPYQIDYGEGVVWQQALLILGPRAYSPGTGLPFVVFHYPPVYYLFVRLFGLFTSDYLSAGRLVASLCSFALGVGAGALVYVTTNGRPRALRAGAAFAVACLVFSLPNIRAFGFLMRVDMLANALGVAGLLIAFTGRPGELRIGAALIVCTLAVFTKQTELAAGITVFVMHGSRRPRQTVGAAAVVAGVAVLAVGWLEWASAGGFLQHVVGYNINRYSGSILLSRLATERNNLPLIFAVMVAAGAALWAPGDTRRRAMVVWFGLNGFSILALGKSGANFNYLNSLYVAGCVVFGVAVVDLVCISRRTALAGSVLTLVVAGWVAQLPLRRLQAYLDTQAPAEQAALVARIAVAAKPVASDDVTLTLRAGKPILFEPAIVTELAATGRWDETPLVQLIEADGLAFVITDHETLDDERRSPRIAAALNARFPRAEQVTPRHWLHLAPLDSWQVEPK